MFKPQRLLSPKLGSYAGEVSAYLRRRRAAQRPFARVYYPDGHSSDVGADQPAGRALFLAAAKLIETARL